MIPRLIPLAVVFFCGCVESGSAYTFCKREVQKRLLSPASAQFPSRGDPDLITSPTKEGGVMILGYVDAQNEHGALLRSNFICEAKRTDGEWNAVSVRVSPVR